MRIDLREQVEPCAFKPYEAVLIVESVEDEQEVLELVSLWKRAARSLGPALALDARIRARRVA